MAPKCLLCGRLNWLATTLDPLTCGSMPGWKAKPILKSLLENDTDATATVSRAPAHFTPHKCLTVDESGIIGFYHAKGQQYSRRQKIPAYYFRNGICYALKRQPLLEKGTIIEKNCKAVVIERPVINIDDEHELAYAEFLLLKDKR
jgi:CMP-N-acetylneuraminic acid synthetase